MTHLYRACWVLAGLGVAGLYATCLIEMGGHP